LILACFEALPERKGLWLTIRCAGLPPGDQPVDSADENR